ncbi:Cys-tRNA(Pro) deacylase [Endozoicomonas arenosclerae]|uniref:Cys-tRNA(Pro) deacylase n=1 Tax=Endozoicomonas arenosclerae TaxID=1633495 RepID=UPI000785E526|nr:Cys-tRNA(Pro) deacylase [Endozoicomonas arenosclerae]
MTPAINTAKRAKISYSVHQYEHDPNCASYGEEAAQKLGLDPAKVFKTLIVSLDSSKLAVGIVPVDSQLDLKSMASACRAKKATMADQNDAARITGYLPGGISPLGQKKRLQTVLDKSAEAFDTIHVSAGRRGLEIELSPSDLLELTAGQYAGIAKDRSR